VASEFSGGIGTYCSEIEKTLEMAPFPFPPHPHTAAGIYTEGLYCHWRQAEGIPTASQYPRKITPPRDPQT
jgi:hypothetical protein